MLRRALVVSSVIAAAMVPAAHAQMNPRGEARVTLAGKPIVIDYGRPALKGRDMLGKAEVGQEWRMGADSATTLKTPVTLTFGSTVVAPGDYVLKAKKTSDTDWLLKLEKDDKVAAEINKAMGQRVTLSYEQKVGLPSCFGDTPYWVTQVRPIEPAK